MEKKEEENEDQEEEKDLRCWIGIGSKAYNLIYNPAKLQRKISNSYGENDPFVQTNLTPEFYKMRGYTLQSDDIL